MTATTTRPAGRAVGLGWGREDGALVYAAPVLIMLGGYLALAGHRSHLYDAMTRQTAATWTRLGLVNQAQ